MLLFFGRKKANFREKNLGEGFNPIGVMDLQIYKRNSARAESGNAETERDRETDPISGGLTPSHAMEAKDLRGNPSPI